VIPENGRKMALVGVPGTGKAGRKSTGVGGKSHAT
jgi:hypothetical protein